MNPREAERLLGGYATGTLTGSERSALLAAALEDQALFDALADEEALRELLADPAARAKLLAALEPKVIPFWRRPGAMTLAASLLVAVGAGLLLKREKPEAMPLQIPLVTPEAAPAPPPPPPPPASQAAPREVRRMKKAPATPQEPAPAAAPAPPAPAPGNAEGAVGGATLDAAPQAKMAAFSTARIAALPPTWTWSGAGAARQLTVRWGPNGFLYLVARDPAGDRLVAPLSVDRAPDGFSRSIFAAPESDTAPLDLYASPVPLTSFPPDGPVKPLRVRP